MYVKGKIANTEQLLVNIGTDYYVEVSTAYAAIVEGASEQGCTHNLACCGSLGLQCTQLLGFQLNHSLRECHLCVPGKAQLQQGFTEGAIIVLLSVDDG